MKKNSTLVSAKTSQNRVAELHARPSTLSAIMQFARSYSYAPKLRGELGSFVAN